MLFPRDSKLDIPPFYTMEMMKFAAELEASGRKVYHLEVGQSIAPTPRPVIERAHGVLNEGELKYCSALGVFELREAIAEHYKYAYGLTINPNCIVITPGTSLGLYTALLMNFRKGAKIAIASPSYPCYRNVIRALDCIPIEIPTLCEQNYLITPENLAKCGHDIAGILIASPNNPTGSMYDQQSLEALSLYCKSQDIHIISDELYHGITYEQKAETILKFNKNATVINGFSKYFAMTGWRVGWMVVPEQDINRYENLLQNMILCTSNLTQIAAAKAFLAYQELDSYVAVYKKNRDILYQTLISAGLNKIYKPHGGFYIYLELDNISLKSMDFCKKLLYEEMIAVAPGIDFVSNSNICSIRLSFCQSQDIIEHAAIKINNFIKKL